MRAWMVGSGAVLCSVTGKNSSGRNSRDGWQPPLSMQDSSRAPQLWETPPETATLSKQDNVSPAQTKSTYFPAHLSLCSFKMRSQALPTRRATKQKCILCTRGRAARCLGPDQKPDTTQAWITGKEPFFPHNDICFLGRWQISSASVKVIHHFIMTNQKPQEEHSTPSLFFVFPGVKNKVASINY